MPFHLFTNTLVQAYLDRLHAPGAERLADFLERGSQQTTRTPEISADFNEIDFEEGTAVRRLTLTRTLDKGFIAHHNIQFTDGTRLDAAGLHIPGINLPQTILATLAGRTIGDVVLGAVLSDLPITGARNVRDRTLLQIEVEESILQVPTTSSPMAPERLAAAALEVADMPCDAVVVAMLRSLEEDSRRMAMVAIAHTESGLVDTGLRWSDVSGGENPPGVDGEIVQGGPEWGRLFMERRKGKPGVTARISIIGENRPANIEIGQGFIYPPGDLGEKASLSHVVGFQLEGDHILKQGSLYGQLRYPLKQTMHLGDALAV